MEAGLRCLDEEDAAADRVVREACDNARRRLIVDSLRAEDWWPNEVLEVGLVDVDEA